MNINICKLKPSPLTVPRTDMILISNLKQLLRLLSSSSSASLSALLIYAAAFPLCNFLYLRVK